MSDKKELLAILTEELSRHPRLTPYDVQKLIYQGVFGSDHALLDRERFSAGLRAEWDALPASDPLDEATLLQRIDPEGRTARVHLMPCKARGVALDGLLELLAAQPLKHGDRSRYERHWRGVVELADAERISFRGEELAGLRFPTRPPHHSRAYGRAAYRVINDVSAEATRVGLRRIGLLE
jgi:hypothetical protein